LGRLVAEGKNMANLMHFESSFKESRDPFFYKIRTTVECCHRSLDANLLAFLVAVALVIGCCFKDQARAGEVSRSRFERINIVGEEPHNGFFDLSVEYGNDGIGWLAYSMVTVPKYVETHLAKSTDQGKTWLYIKAINRWSAGSVNIRKGTQEGVWRYETPTLLFDPKDIPARRWKLFVHRYLAIPPYKRGDRLFERGWIEYKYAATPDGRWSEGIRLFGKKENNCQVDLNTLHSDLRNFHHFTEPGSIAIDGTIYISMDASVTPSGLGKWKQRKVVLVSSQDHGITWNYVGILTDYNDASAFGYVTMTGSSLVKENERLFLMLTPTGAKGIFKKNRAHDGTLVVEFHDIRHAKLKREAKGKLAVLKTLKPDLNSGGLSDYDEQNTAGGILFSQINISAMPEIFQIFSTKERIAQQGAPADSD
jgi:hypothetical protein